MEAVRFFVVFVAILSRIDDNEVKIQLPCDWVCVANGLKFPAGVPHVTGLRLASLDPSDDRDSHEDDRKILTVRFLLSGLVYYRG